jgi:hypothetical protein
MKRNEEIEFVDMDILSEYVGASIDVSFEGSYPLQIRDHSVFLARKRDNLQFYCTLCGESIRTSYTVWSNTDVDSRRKATKYVAGKFYNCECEPNEMRDIIDYVYKDHIGDITSPETMRTIEKEMEMEIGPNDW